MLRGGDEDIGKRGNNGGNMVLSECRRGSRMWVKAIREERRDSAVIVMEGRMELLEWTQIKV